MDKQERADRLKECVDQAAKLISEATVHARHLEDSDLFNQLFNMRLELHGVQEQVGYIQEVVR